MIKRAAKASKSGTTNVNPTTATTEEMAPAQKQGASGGGSGFTILGLKPSPEVITMHLAPPPPVRNLLECAAAWLTRRRGNSGGLGRSG
jgi:hypothetical protein